MWECNKHFTGSFVVFSWITRKAKGFLPTRIVVDNKKTRLAWLISVVIIFILFCTNIGTQSWFQKFLHCNTNYDSIIGRSILQYMLDENVVRNLHAAFYEFWNAWLIFKFYFRVHSKRKIRIPILCNDKGFRYSIMTLSFQNLSFRKYKCIKH